MQGSPGLVVLVLPEDRLMTPVTAPVVVPEWPAEAMQRYVMGLVLGRWQSGC
jgi:hypothetical protein